MVVYRIVDVLGHEYVRRVLTFICTSACGTRNLSDIAVALNIERLTATGITIINFLLEDVVESVVII